MELEVHDSLSGEDFEKALAEADDLLRQGVDEKNLELLEKARKKYSLAQLRQPKDARAWIGVMSTIEHACVIQYTEPVDAARMRLSLVDMARVRSSAMKIITEEPGQTELQRSYRAAVARLDAFFPPRGKKHKA